MAVSTKIAIVVITGVVIIGAILGPSLYFGLGGRNSVVYTNQMFVIIV